MKKIAFYSRAFYTGGMENAVYNLCRLLNNTNKYEISILFKESNEKTEKMLAKLSTVATVSYVEGQQYDLDVLINCDRKDFILPCVKAKKTIHWFSSCLIENKDKLQGKVITQSKWHYDQLQKLGIDSKIIGNPLDVNNIIVKSKEKVEKYGNDSEIKYLIVARISPEKGFNRAIQFIMSKRFENSRLFILGSPTMPNSDTLVQKIKLALREKVVFLGERDNPYPYMLQTDYILCLSDNEIYGLVSEEAHILGKQVIFNHYPTALDQFIDKFDMWYDMPISKSDENYNKDTFFDNNLSRFNAWKEFIDE